MFSGLSSLSPGNFFPSMSDIFPAYPPSGTELTPHSRAMQLADDAIAFEKENLTPPGGTSRQTPASAPFTSPAAPAEGRPVAAARRTLDFQATPQYASRHRATADVEHAANARTVPTADAATVRNARLGADDSRAARERADQASYMAHTVVDTALGRVQLEQGARFGLGEFEPAPDVDEYQYELEKFTEGLYDYSEDAAIETALNVEFPLSRPVPDAPMTVARPSPTTPGGITPGMLARAHAPPAILGTTSSHFSSPGVNPIASVTHLAPEQQIAAIQAASDTNAMQVAAAVRQSANRDSVGRANAGSIQRNARDFPLAAALFKDKRITADRMTDRVYLRGIERELSQAKQEQEQDSLARTGVDRSRRYGNAPQASQRFSRTRRDPQYAGLKMYVPPHTTKEPLFTNNREQWGLGLQEGGSSLLGTAGETMGVAGGLASATGIGAAAGAPLAITGGVLKGIDLIGSDVLSLW